MVSYKILGNIRIVIVKISLACICITSTLQLLSLSPQLEYNFGQDFSDNVEKATGDLSTRGIKKDWTFIAYVAADNDLRGFAARNIKQMAQIGSNNYLNIAVQLDIRITGNKKITRRYFIEKNKIWHVNAEDPFSQQMDSGDPQTLISCCRWAIENYPAKNYALIFWNHGTGIIDPSNGRIINSSELFTFNPTINKFELDRSIGFLDFINQVNREERGICWDDSSGNYLTNQKLDFALHEICTSLLGGNKFSIIGFDACLMSMLEVANILKKYASIMTGSQEVELGTGWDYSKVLSPFVDKTLSPTAFAEHIVSSYASSYEKITNDYTQSALNLEHIDSLESNVNTVANLLLYCLKNQNNNSVKNAIRASRNKLLCTHFDEPSYIDLHHFYENLLANVKHFSFTNKNEEGAALSALQETLEKGRSLITEFVVANSTGKNLSRAKGISIYFPERRIHTSYRKTTFASTNEWITFLTSYLLL